MDKKTYTCICTAILGGALVLVNNDKVNYIGFALCAVGIITGVIVISREIKKK